MRLRARLAAALFAVCFSHAVFAACPGDAGEPLPPPDQLAALEHGLASLAGECGARAGYLAYRGALLNALGRPAEAALLLEQALLLDPRHAGAQIDYAESLAALGDGASAAAMLSSVLARSDVPAALRPGLERRLAGLDERKRAGAPAGAAPASPWEGAGSLALKLGTESNLNSAPARDSLTLSLPGGDAVFLLGDRFRARAGTAGLAEASGQLALSAGGGSALLVHGDARLRDSRGAPDTDYQQAQAGGAWRLRLDGGLATFSAGASQLRYGGADLYRASRLGVVREWAMEPCRPNAGLEAEWRHYPVAPELQGRFLGVSAGLTCQAGANRLVLAARGGQDSAQSGRPGDNQRHTDLRLVWNRPLGPGKVSADVLWHRQRDASGYSTLLENGAARAIERASAVIEYAHPVGRRWSVVASVEAIAQRSNLGLFDMSGRAYYLGLRWSTGK